MSSYKPMLAPSDDPLKNPNYFKSLKYPLLASPKLDGVRMVVKAYPEIYVRDDFEVTEATVAHYKCLSRTLKEIPSRQVQKLFTNFAELDGELIVGCEWDYNVCNRTVGHVMSIDKPADNLTYRVFDFADEEFAELPFEERLECARAFITETQKLGGSLQVKLIEHTRVNNYDELIEYEEHALAIGYEGIMLRNPNGRYKHNRGTFKEGLIYKLKRFNQDEAVIVGFEEGYANENEKMEDERGYAKRSTAKEGLIAAGTVGKLVGLFAGQEIRIAPGALTHSERDAIWKEPEKYIGKIVSFRHFAHGAKDAPRFARFVCFRDKIDIGEV